MFGRSKPKKESPSSNTQGESGAIIQGFVCPMCLLSFSSSHDLEVHFQMNHDKPKVEDDEVALMQHQLSAAEQTRDLMQREIARQLETIQALEATVATLTSGRNEAEVSLQKTLLELQNVRQSLETERKTGQEAVEKKRILERNLVELQTAIAAKPDPNFVEQLKARCESSEKVALAHKHEAEELQRALSARPDISYVEQLKSRCESSEKMILAQKQETDRNMSEHLAEVARLQDTLLGVRKSYQDFMGSLAHLLANIESFEKNGTPQMNKTTAELGPECVGLLELLSTELKKQFDDKERLRSALHDHELMREKFVQEKSKLEKQLKDLEKMQSNTRFKLIELSKYICHSGSDSPLNDISTDDISLLDAIHRSFDSLSAKNAQLQSEIEQNVSDEDVLKRLKQEYKTAIEEKSSEISLLQSDFGATKKRLAEFESLSDRSKQDIEALEIQLSSLSAENSTLQTATEAQDRLIRHALKQLDGSTQPFSFGTYPCIEEGEFFKVVSAVTGRAEELQADLDTWKSKQESQERNLRTIEEQKAALDLEILAKNETISRLETAFKKEQAESSRRVISLEEELDRLKSEVNDLQQSHDVGLQTITSLKIVQKDHEDKIKQLKSDFQEQIENLNRELLSKNEAISRLTTSLEEQQDEASKRVMLLEEDLHRLKAEVRDLQQIRDISLQTISSLTNERDNNDEKIKQLERELQERKETNERELLSKNDAISRLETALEQANVESGERLSSYDEELKSVEKRVDDLQKAYDSHLTLIDVLTNERNINGEKVAQLESQFQESGLLLEESMSFAKQKESQVAELTAQLEAMKSRCGDADSRLLAIANDKFEMEKRLSEFKQQLSTVNSENQQLNERCSSLDASLVACQSRLQMMEQALNETNEQKAKTQAEMDEMQAVFMSTQVSMAEELQTANSTIEELQISLNKERLAMSQLNADVRIAQEACRNLEKVNSDLNFRCNEIAGEANNSRLRNEELEQNVAKLKLENMNETARLRGEFDKLLETKETFLKTQYSAVETKLRAEMSGLLTRLEQSQTESQDLEDELNDLQRRNQELQLALQELGREQQNLQIKHVKSREHRWQDDSEATSCRKCDQRFSLTVRKHHCRNCGLVFCNTCTAKTAMVGATKKPVRVCDACHKELLDS